MNTLIKAFAFFALTAFLNTIANGQEGRKQNLNSIRNISFSMLSEPSDVGSGLWATSRQGNSVIVKLTNSRRNQGEFEITFSIDQRELQRTSDGFQIEREAATLKFVGEPHSNENSGRFSFIRNASFERFLNAQVSSDVQMKDKDYYFLKMFLGNVTEPYVLDVKKLGYLPSMYLLGKMGYHGVRLDYLAELKRMDYANLDLDMIIKWVIHDISVSYLDQLSEAGYGNIDAEMVKKFAIHGVTMDYINGLSRVGYGNLEAEMLKKFVIHEISPSYIQSLLETNIPKPDSEEIKRAKIHNVTASFIERARNAGHDSKDLNDFINLKIKGV